MSKYQEFLAEVESRKCPECSGLGEYDDSEPGDIAYNTYRCKPCKGTGFKDGQTYKATFVPGGDVR